MYTMINSMLHQERPVIVVAEGQSVFLDDYFICVAEMVFGARGD